MSAGTIVPMSTPKRKRAAAKAASCTTTTDEVVAVDERKKDRHKPAWSVRLPAYFRAAVEEFARNFSAEQGLEIDGTTVIKAAVREYLERKGAWPGTSA